MRLGTWRSSSAPVESMMRLVSVCWKMMGVGDTVDDAVSATSEEH
jgi:hypothetical protein